MLEKLINRGTTGFFSSLEYKRVQQMLDEPIALQDAVFQRLLEGGKSTDFGVKYLGDVIDYASFRANVPLHSYDDISPFFQRAIAGEKNVTWKGKIKWFSKSSGTTKDVSKIVPLTKDYIKEGLLQGGRDTLSMYIRSYPDTELFAGKTLIMGGTYESTSGHVIGDVSAIMMEHMPFYGKYFNTPNMETALMSDWEEKIDKMVAQTITEDVRFLSGVPTWSIVLFKKILAYTGAKHMHEIWPNFELFIHGGVNFKPYKKQFEAFFPNGIVFHEVYNASEGFFASSLKSGDDDMLLLLDNGVFYEFIPFTDYYSTPNESVIALVDVKIDVPYVLVISSINGNWRYVVGDVITFSSIAPYKIKILGRTSQYLNVFGEELMIHTVEEALSIVCKKVECAIKEFTVAPIFLSEGNKGGHEWAIEFDEEPLGLAAFEKLLDETLQSLNSDYAAKRYKNIALEQLSVNKLSEGTFGRYQKSKNKIGNQNKVPRLLNDRKFLIEVLSFS